MYFNLKKFLFIFDECLFAFLTVLVRDMHPCQSDDADCALRSSGCLQEMLREDDTDRCLAEIAAAALRHLQGKDSAIKGQLFPLRKIDKLLLNLQWAQ